MHEILIVEFCYRFSNFTSSTLCLNATYFLYLSVYENRLFDKHRFFLLLLVPQAVFPKKCGTKWLFKGNKEFCVEISLRSTV